MFRLPPEDFAELRDLWETALKPGVLAEHSMVFHLDGEYVESDLSLTTFNDIWG